MGDLNIISLTAVTYYEMYPTLFGRKEHTRTVQKVSQFLHYSLNSCPNINDPNKIKGNIASSMKSVTRNETLRT